MERMDVASLRCVACSQPAVGLQLQGWRGRAGRAWIEGMQSLSVRVLGEFDVDGVEPSALGSR